jgi:nitrogen-specific signal transduction histidine kinase
MRTKNIDFYKLALDSLPWGVSFISLGGDFMYANEAFCKAINKSEADILGKGVQDYITEFNLILSWTHNREGEKVFAIAKMQKDISQSEGVNSVASWENFLSGVIHEINNPLSVIAGQSELMQIHMQKKDQIPIDKLSRGTVVISEMMLHTYT